MDIGPRRRVALGHALPAPSRDDPQPCLRIRGGRCSSERIWKMLYRRQKMTGPVIVLAWACMALSYNTPRHVPCGSHLGRGGAGKAGHLYKAASLVSSQAYAP